MSLTEFRNRLEEKLHAFLWRQWSQMGVAGSASGEDLWIIDPEALLLFTLEAARSEPRLFDEVLSWLLKNGALVDVQRVRNLKRQDKNFPTQVLHAVASLLAAHETSAKWKRLAGERPSPTHGHEPFFILPGKGPMPSPKTLDPHFERAGYSRSAFAPRALTEDIPLSSPPCIRFRLRAFFGIGIRAEVIAYLLTHEGGVNGDAVARAVGYSPPGVQGVLREMEASSQVLSRREGREKRYSVDRTRWYEFLDLTHRVKAELRSRQDEVTALAKSEEIKFLGGKTQKEAQRLARDMVGSLAPPVTWINWARFFQGFARVLRFLRSTKLERMSPYVEQSEFSKMLEVARDDLEGAEIAFHLPKPKPPLSEAYLERVENALLALLD